MIVGVTGGIGSGKSAVTSRFEALGITVVDADIAARVVVEPGGAALEAIAQRHGEAILLPDGSLDRAALRKIVFADEAERHWLEALTHPLIGQEIRDQLAAATSPYAILASPLLLETQQKDLTDLIVVVDVPEDIQLSRTVARDNNDEAQVKRIMAAQMSREERVGKADIVIDNSKSLNALDGIVEQLHAQFLAQSA
ncbi:dephospho-CoA kinase [Halioglobus japonicus]|uniref:Dephospho-CoA kinase n=1 Tax=Halioglobus japonicus TaxID=930805 RepID=A0AAP8MG39_9GAMM|nr:dephospho-CoA kinase [Halioglobus japonicus]AQA19766.1 dephospho-CoA kinase [Halioglobus japonicus]PLW87162.1 dephospho-CoA kinase [Halioglobus japonicus]GHD09902.1 dephospho-CoA kinase [Halioglobus japonicus]